MFEESVNLSAEGILGKGNAPYMVGSGYGKVVAVFDLNV